jgi:cell division GTPase FtsZ
MRIVVILQNPNRGPGIEMMIKRIDICIIIRNENLLSVKDARMN